MQVHVINLKEATERRKSIVVQLEKLNLPFEIFEAIKGMSLSDEELSEQVDMNEVVKYPIWLSRNAIGCALSHNGVFRKIINSDNEWHLILEDDVNLDNEIVEIFNHIQQNKKIYKGHLILLYCISVNGFVMLSKQPIDSLTKYRIHKVLSNDELSGAGAYIIHRDTAKKILTTNTPVKVTNDIWHYFFVQGAIDQIDCVYPFAAKPGLFESTIGYMNPKSITFKIKNFINKYKVPILYAALRRNRKKVWDKTSKVQFV
jgi:glycosyl transferase family 25